MSMPKKEKGTISRKSSSIARQEFYDGTKIRREHKHNKAIARKTYQRLKERKNYDNYLDLSETYKTYTRDYAEEEYLRKITPRMLKMKLDRDCLKFTHLFTSDKNGRWRKRIKRIFHRW